MGSYLACAQRIITHALQRRSQRRLFVDIDNTINNAWERIQRSALPTWPGETFDQARAFSHTELLSDRPLLGSQASLAALARDWDITFLSARGAAGLVAPTLQWLAREGFVYSKVILVRDALDKVAWLEDAVAESEVLFVDYFTRGHHTAQPVVDEELLSALRARAISFKVFVPAETGWPELAQQLAIPVVAPTAMATGQSASEQGHLRALSCSSRKQ